MQEADDAANLQLSEAARQLTGADADIANELSAFKTTQGTANTGNNDRLVKLEAESECHAAPAFERGQRGGSKNARSRQRYEDASF